MSLLDSNRILVSPSADEVEVSHQQRSVVAYPRGRKSTNLIMKPRPRSLSAGRNRKNAQDVVQSVYDRLGVRRGQWISDHAGKPDSEKPAIEQSSGAVVDEEAPRAVTSPARSPRPSERRTSSSSAFHERFRAAATKSRGRAPAPAATEQPPTIQERRARSLSRGRLAKRWPPAKSSQPEEEPVTCPSPPQSSPKLTVQTRAVGGAPKEINTALVMKRLTGSSKEITEAGEFMDLNLDTQTDVGRVNSSDETTARQDLLETKSMSGPSLQDRMKAYNGMICSNTRNTRPSSTRAIDNKQYAANFAVRDHPPKIDIYSNKPAPILHQDEKKEDESTTHPESLTEHDLVQSPRGTPRMIGGKATTTSSTVSSLNNMSQTPRRVRGSGTKLANSYMASIQQQQSPRAARCSTPKSPTPIPVAEITEGNDVASAAMSSVSGTDEFHQHSQSLRMPEISCTSKPTWQSRPKQQQAVSSSMDSAAINKIIDERVQAHIADMETRFGAQMRRWMQQMDDKVLMRLEAMENRMSELQNALNDQRMRR